MDAKRPCVCSRPLSRNIDLYCSGPERAKKKQTALPVIVESSCLFWKKKKSEKVSCGAEHTDIAHHHLRVFLS